MKTIGNIVVNAYLAVILAALVAGPLIILHGYRAWWLVTFYAVVAVATIGGIISHYRIVGRNKKSSISESGN